MRELLKSFMKLLISLNAMRQNVVVKPTAGHILDLDFTKRRMRKVSDDVLAILIGLFLLFLTMAVFSDNG